MGLFGFGKKKEPPAPEPCKHVSTHASWHDPAKAETPAPKRELTAEEICSHANREFWVKNYKGALPLYTKAAELGSVDAQYGCGVMYQLGHGTEKDVNKALMWFEKAAGQGHAGAQYQCGLAYAMGKGTTKDPAKALMWYEKAAGQGYKYAITELERLKARLEESTPAPQPKPAPKTEVPEAGMKRILEDSVTAYEAQDYEKALMLFEQAAELGYAKAQFNCGVMYANGEGTTADKTKALMWFEKAARQGDADAQFCCGMMYKKGEGTEKDSDRALMWFKEAARQGNQDAQKLLDEACEVAFVLGSAAFKAKEYKDALALFKKAAELDYAKAQFYCGMLYHYGKGTAVDKARALMWYEKAAGQGDADAQLNCGMMYEIGEGTAVDEARAKMWFEKAAAQAENKEVQEEAEKILRQRF